MRIDFTQKLINSWEWLNSYCLSKRDDYGLSCGRHAVCVVQIDDFYKMKIVWGNETGAILKNMEEIMSDYAMDDNLIARFSDSTFVVVLHYLDSLEEINEICEEMKAAINDAHLGTEDAPLTVSIGASICRHDPNYGYQCAMSYALEALEEAHKQKDTINVSKALA